MNTCSAKSMAGRVTCILSFLLAAQPLLAADQHLTPNERLRGAARSGDVNEIVSALRAGASVQVAVKGRYEPQNPLNVAVTWGNIAAVKVLLKWGANPSRAIDDAVCNPDILQILLDERADPNYSHGSLVSPLYGAIVTGGSPKLEEKCMASAALLIKYGARVDGKGGTLPLVGAIQANSLPFVKFFLANGANVNLVDAAGLPPLLEAIFARGLMEPCGNRSRGQPDCVAATTNAQVIRVLLDHGADPNFRDKNRWVPTLDKLDFRYISGSTALCVAARYGWDDIAKLLLTRGADSRIPRSDGSLPFAIARENGHVRTAALISGATDMHRVKTTGRTVP